MHFLWFSYTNSHWAQGAFDIGFEQFIGLKDVWAVSESWALPLSWNPGSWPFRSLAKYQFFPHQSWKVAASVLLLTYQLSFSLFVLSRVQHQEPLPRVYLQVSPAGLDPSGLCLNTLLKPVWFLAPSKVVLEVTAAYLWPSPSTLHKRPTFSCLASAKIPGSDAPRLLISLVSGMGGR